MRRLFAWLTSLSAESRRGLLLDAAGVSGLALVVWGLALWSVPLALVVPGLALIGLSVWGAFR